jgi:hypothetical protein
VTAATMKCSICRADTHRYACDDCCTDIRRRLREVEAYAEWLASPTMLLPSRGGDGGRRAPGFGSRPPIRIDAVLMNDRRSRTEPPPVDEARGIGVDEDSGPWPILGTLRVIAGHIREARGHPLPASVTLASEVVYVLQQVDWAAGQPGIAELAKQIRQLHTQVRAVAQDAPPKPLGSCLSDDCEGVVFPPQPRRSTTRCTACGRSYDWLGLVRVRLAQEVGR